MSCVLRPWRYEVRCYGARRPVVGLGQGWMNEGELSKAMAGGCGSFRSPRAYISMGVSSEELKRVGRAEERTAQPRARYKDWRASLPITTESHPGAAISYTRHAKRDGLMFPGDADMAREHEANAVHSSQLSLVQGSICGLSERRAPHSNSRRRFPSSAPVEIACVLILGCLGK